MSSSTVPINALKYNLKRGQSMVGLMLAEFREPSILQLFQNAGFNFVLLDNEHGPFTLESIASLSRTGTICL
jgi:2-keto-3-deoxy-L-rhamnonate aldolase RhmA